MHEGTLECWIIFTRALVSKRSALTLSQRIANMQTKQAVPDRIPIRLQVTMRAILPISCSLLRSWTVLPSGL